MRTTPHNPAGQTPQPGRRLRVGRPRPLPRALYNSTELRDGLDTDLNVTIGTVWNMCDWRRVVQRRRRRNALADLAACQGRRHADRSGVVDYLSDAGGRGRWSGVACLSLLTGTATSDWWASYASCNRQSSMQSSIGSGLREYDVMAGGRRRPGPPQPLTSCSQAASSTPKPASTTTTRYYNHHRPLPSNRPHRLRGRVTLYGIVAMTL